MIPARIHSIATDSSQNNFFAVLTTNKDGEDRWLPVRLGAAEAVSIATEINEGTRERPASHDLITRLVTELGGSIDEVQLNRSDSELEAKLRLVTPDGQLRTLEARPSDALAVAVRIGVEISVEEKLLKDSSRPFSGEYFENAHPSGEVTRLQFELREAIEEEDYERASDLKSDIQSAVRRHEESLEDVDEDLVQDLENAFDSEESEDANGE